MPIYEFVLPPLAMTSPLATREEPHRLESPFSATSSALSDARDLAHKFEEVGGSKCEAVTQLNSARKDLFV